MTQFDLGTIVPSTTSGSSLASKLGQRRDAEDTTHSGATRPSYVKPGMIWLDTSGAPWLLKMWDGVHDAILQTVDPETGLTALSDRYTKAEADARNPLPLIVSYNSDMLAGTTGFVTTLPDGFSSFKIEITNLAASESGVLFARLGPKGGSLHAGSSDYAYQVYGQHSTAGAINGSFASGRIDLVGLDPASDNHASVELRDGTLGGRATLISHLVSKTLGGVDFANTRGGICNPTGVKKLLSIGSTVQLARSGQIKIYGVR